MKKIFLLLATLALLPACSDEKTDSQTQSEPPSKEIQMFKLPSQEILNQKFSFTTESPASAYTNTDPVINAINGAVKCTLTPKDSACTALNIPKFILMEDESLQRPTQMQYQITKIKPLAGGLLHIYTQSQCNNNWFGLCQGTIVYALQSQNDRWYVADIFALAETK